MKLAYSHWRGFFFFFLLMKWAYSGDYKRCYRSINFFLLAIVSIIDYRVFL